MDRRLSFAFVIALLGCAEPSTSIDAAMDRDARATGDARTDDASAMGTHYGAPVQVGTLPASGLPETSGIVASRAHPGVFWVENDSGNPADVFAIDETGALLATIHVAGATNVDWEDISIDARAGVEEIYVADTGDNAARTSDGAMGRASVRIYRFPEPDASLGDATITAETLTFTYPARPYDCEAVFVDHRTGDVYFVTKEPSPAEVFVARAPLDPTATTLLTHVGTIDLAIATAADMSTDGARVVVRGYAVVRVFPVDAADVAASFASPFITAMSGSAAEAIAFEHDGYGLYTVAEGDASRLYYLPFE
jgi:hypothetical protein